MIWIILGEESHQAVSCNIHKNENKFELWITRPNGKSLLIKTGNKEEIKELKEAIDYAIEIGASTFKIK